MKDVNLEMSRTLVHWARQTIAFAISLRAEDDGSPLTQEAQLRHVGSATERVVNELWDDVYRACPAADQFVMRFARRVLDWAQDHRGGKDGPG